MQNDEAQLEHLHLQDKCIFIFSRYYSIKWKQVQG